MPANKALSEPLGLESVAPTQAARMTREMPHFVRRAPLIIKPCRVDDSSTTRGGYRFVRRRETDVESRCSPGEALPLQAGTTPRAAPSAWPWHR